jgi:hypothetical protein
VAGEQQACDGLHCVADPDTEQWLRHLPVDVAVSDRIGLLHDHVFHIFLRVVAPKRLITVDTLGAARATLATRAGHLADRNIVWDSCFHNVGNSGNSSLGFQGSTESFLRAPSFRTATSQLRCTCREKVV